MALSPEQTEELQKSFKTIKNKPWRFLYCVAGPDRDPVLLVSRRKVPSERAQLLRRMARKKKFVRGFVRLDDSRNYVFEYIKEPPAEFERHLKQFFSKAVGKLRKATVRPLQVDSTEDVIDVRSLSADIAQEQVQLEAETAQLNDRLSRMQDQTRSAQEAVREALAELEAERNAWFPDPVRIEQLTKTLKRSQKKLSKLEAAEEVTETALAAAREQMEQAVAESAAAREQSDALLATWSEEQAAFWQAQKADGWREQMATQAVEHAELARQHDAAVAALAALQSERKTAERRVDQATAARADIAAEIARLQEDIRSIKAEHEQAGAQYDLSEVSALHQAQERLEALRERDREFAVIIASGEDAQERLVDEIYVSERRAERARVRAGIAKERLRMELMSEEERRLSSALVMRHIDAEAQLRLRQDAVQEAKRQHAVESAGHQEVRDAEASLREATMRLQAARIQRQDMADIAGQWGLLSDSDAIARAGKLLPKAVAEEEAAQEAFEQARAALQAARADSDDDINDRVDAEDALVDARKLEAQARQEVLQIEQQLADDQARVMAIAADLQRSIIAEKTASLIETSPGMRAAKEKKDAAVAAVDAAQEALGGAERALVARKQQLAEMTEALADRASPRQLKALRKQLSQLSKLQRARDTAQAEVNAALQEELEAERRMAEQLQAEATADPSLRGAMDSLARAEVEQQRAAEDAAAASRKLVSATQAVAEAERRAEVIDDQAKLEQLIDDHRDLIDTFHDIRDPSSDDALIIDLLDDADRAKIAAHPDLQKLLRLQRRLESRAQKMLRAGATAQELEVAFAGVPGGLRPASYRAEVAAFQLLDQSFDLSDAEREDARVLQRARAVVRPEQRKAEASATLRSLITSETELSTALAVLDSDAIKDDPHAIEQIHTALGSLQSALDNIDAGQMETMQDLQAEIAQSLVGLQKLGVDVVGMVGPIMVQIAGPADDVYRNICAASIRQGQARHTALLARAAKVCGSPLASAFEESLAQENKLWAKYSVMASMDALDITGRLLLQFPGTAALGVAITLGSYVGQELGDIGQTLADWRVASKAKTLLAKARRGSARARTELLKYHPLYAKGLIVHMAKNNDPFARMYMTKRGLEESQIKQRSADILTHYLLQDAEQLDDDGELKLETAAEWWDKQREQLAGSISSGLSAVSRAIEQWRTPEFAKDFGRTAQIQAAAEELTCLLGSASRARARITDPEQLILINGLIGEYRKTLSIIRREAVGGLSTLASAESQASTLRALAHQDKLEADALEALQIFEKALPEMRRDYLSIVQHVTEAA